MGEPSGQPEPEKPKPPTESLTTLVGEYSEELIKIIRAAEEVVQLRSETLDAFTKAMQRIDKLVEPVARPFTGQTPRTD